MLRHKNFSNLAFDYFVAFLLLLFGLLCLLPLLHLLALSLSSSHAALSGFVSFLPVDFTTTAYSMLIRDERYIAAFMVSVQRIILGGGINLILTILTAYPLSMEPKDFPGRNIYMWVVLFTMLFVPSVVPWFFVIRATGLLDSIWALVLPGAVPVFNTILLMNFFRNQPKEIRESALIDGAGPIQMMVRIAVPLAMPAIATVTMFSIVHHWNSFFDGMILINAPSRIPLQTYIQSLIAANVTMMAQSGMTPEELAALSSLRTFNAARTIVAIIPILIVYPFMQRFFVTGITLGSVKG